MVAPKRGYDLFALLVGAFLLLRGNNAQAAQVSVNDQDTSDAPREADNNPAFNAPTGEAMTNLLPTDDPAEVSRRVAAFLYMIRACEHVYPRDVVNDAAYGIFYGGARFYDFTDHPVITGELRPVKLSDAVCAASGLGPGCVSSAAGAYQFIRPTWTQLRDRYSLPDFSPASQDAAAAALLDELRVTDLLRDGDITGAVALASRTWASLPGSKAQQGPKTALYALDRFAEGLGTA